MGKNGQKSIPGAGIIGHVVGLIAGIGVVLFFFRGQWKPGSLATAIGVGIWWGVASIIKNVLTIRPADQEESSGIGGEAENESES